MRLSSMYWRALYFTLGESGRQLNQYANKTGKEYIFKFTLTLFHSMLNMNFHFLK